VYTYLLRPLTAPGRDRNAGDTSTTQQQQQRQQQQQLLTAGGGSHSQSSCSDDLLARASTGMLAAGRQGSGGDAVVGYELQLVMELCPLVSEGPPPAEPDWGIKKSHSFFLCLCMCSCVSCLFRRSFACV
jgi:hypothetical protein